MPHASPTLNVGDAPQYDKYGSVYDNSKLLPTAVCQIASMRRYVGNVKGLKVLDLACGSGDFSRRLINWGASHVTAVDISSGMIKGARAREGAGSRITYMVADCSKPLGLEEEGFDMVFAAWLLNYAATEEQLTEMWMNVARYLKPGGRLVGIIPNFEHIENERWYGVTNRIIDRFPGGVRRETTLLTTPPVTFTNYTLERPLYERSAKRSGMVDFQVRDMITPAEDEDFWRGHLGKPTFHPITASKASLV